MPHGRPEEGVKKTGFALVTLKKPLEFNADGTKVVCGGTSVVRNGLIAREVAVQAWDA